MVALYIHIPFCQKLCPYCDFNTYATKNIPESDYLDALIHELRLVQERYYDNKTVITSVFWGGGTPSLLSGDSLSRLHEQVDRLFTLNFKEAEVTVEANPNDLVEEKIATILQSGVNRVSIGAQSLQPQILSRLGRDHGRKDVKNAVSRLQDAGCSNISLDLIFGVPNETTPDLERDLEGFFNLHPQHISTYSLTIERSTPFFKAVETGAMPAPDDEVVREQYERILSLTEQRGFTQYEVSNFAREPRYESDHNKAYWKRDGYIGIGAGAHSFHKHHKLRCANIGNPDHYMNRLQNEESIEAWSEALTEEDELSEIIMLGLRTKTGMKLQKVPETLSLKLHALQKENLGILTKETFRLTTKGLCIADSIIADLIASVVKRQHNP